MCKGLGGFLAFTVLSIVGMLFLRRFSNKSLTKPNTTRFSYYIAVMAAAATKTMMMMRMRMIMMMMIPSGGARPSVQIFASGRIGGIEIFVLPPWRVSAWGGGGECSMM